MQWKEVTFILRGRIRKAVLKALDSPKTATIIAKELDTHRSTVSRILGVLDEKGFVLCLDKGEPYNRYYHRTKQGDKALQEINKLQS